MPRKKKEEEHENLERWMVSYADFMTLLFATFVVLYALNQVSASAYEQLQQSIQDAFSGASASMENLMNLSGADMLNADGQSLMNQGATPNPDSFVPPIMEYVSAKYERESMEDIKKEIEEATAKGELDGIEAEITDRGLVIRLKDVNFFESGSATIKPSSYPSLDKIGALITKRFQNHLIRVEGHTDNLPLSSQLFPSNWELSSARSSGVARFLIKRHKIKNTLFTVIGYAETKPLVTNATPENRAKNRRVEIVILKNQVAKNEPGGEDIIAGREKALTEKLKIKEKKSKVSEAAKNLMDEETNKEMNNVIILDEYSKAKNSNIKQQIHEFERKKDDFKDKVRF